MGITQSMDTMGTTQSMDTMGTMQSMDTTRTTTQSMDTMGTMQNMDTMRTMQSMDKEMVRAHDEIEKKLQDSNAAPISLPLEFLKAITCDFSTESELGRGGYGVVYKGVLWSGKVIAVKKLFEIRLKEETFQKEVIYLMGIKHQNVVQLIGYCAESKWEAIEQPSGSGKHIFAEMPKRLLCFEYVSNKSLDKHIYDESLGLEWNLRYKIIKGICNGLYFLHNECRMVHLDLKPTNILMDSTMTPKIADFGLSRIFGDQQSRIVTNNPAGSFGYMAPEYLTQGVVSNKADIFSLGVMIIEIITGRRDYPYFQQDSPRTTATALQQFMEKVVGSWTNQFISTQKHKSTNRYTQQHQVRKCIAIAIKCVDPSMEARPTAKNIIQMLNDVYQHSIPTLRQNISMEKTREDPQAIISLDVNLTKPWIVIGHMKGYIDIWNYETRKSMGSVYTGDGYTVCSIKFIERKQWFVAGSEYGFMYVYNYKTELQKITSFRAEAQAYSIDSLAVHPSEPYVLSPHYQYIKLWDWDKRWECIQRFERQPTFGIRLTFNQNDASSFASASFDHTIKIWSLDSVKHKYTLSGHSLRVNCLDFFTRDGMQYLITGSDDKTAKIWDMQKKTCICTLEGFMSSVISVASHPSLSVLITGTADGTIHLWSSADFSLVRILKHGGLGAAIGLTCLRGSRRVVIANYWALSIMEIHDEEPDSSCASMEVS